MRKTGSFYYLASLLVLLISCNLWALELKISDEKEDSFYLHFLMDENDFQVEDFELSNNIFSKISLKNYKSGDEVSGPDFPQISKFLMAPEGKTLSFEIIEEKYSSLFLPHPLSPKQDEGNHCQMSTSPFLASIYENALTSPSASFKLGKFSGLASIQGAFFHLSPFRFARDPQQYQRIEYLHKLLVKVSFLNQKRKTKNVGNISPNLLRRFVFNHHYLKVSSNKRRNHSKRELYFVYDNNDYMQELEPLFEYKRNKKGIEITLIKIKDKTAEEIKEMIKGEYASSNPPQHTILVGNIKEIPSFNYQNAFWSDYPYALLDEGDFPDLSIARFPVKNRNEIKQMVTKILRREKEARDSSKLLITSGKETGWCHQNLKYIMDEILAPSQIPLNITKMYVSEGFKKEDFIMAYNQDPNIIVYDGHGNQTAMTEIPFSLNDFSLLQNNTFPIVLDIACHNSYWPIYGDLTPNFAESLVSLEDHGAAGIFASSYYASAHNLFRFVFRGAFYNELEAEGDSRDFEPIIEVGELLLYSKLKYLETENSSYTSLRDNHMFFYHGDPAQTFY